MNKVSLPWHGSSWLLALLLFIPILALLALSFAPDGDIFTHLWHTVLLDYSLNTLVLLLLVAVLVLVMALPAAWLMAMCELPGKKILQWALILPLAMPAYIVAAVYTELFEYSGPVQAFLRFSFGWQSPSDYWFFDIRSLGGAAFVLASVLFPYVYLLARTAFLEQSTYLFQSSRLLGSSPWQSFLRISLPLARPAIVVGLTLVAMETMADFATVHYFALNTLTTAVYDTWLEYGSLSAAAKISSFMLLAILLLLGAERLSRRQQHTYQKGMSHESESGFKLSVGARLLASSYCWLLVFIGFLLPALVLVSYAIDHFEQSFSADFFEYMANSLLLATVVSLLAVLIALLFGFYARLHGGSIAKLPSRLVASGYALPGTLLAIGVLIPLTFLDHRLNELLIAMGFSPVGLILTGSLVALGFAYLVRFSTMAVGAVESSLEKVSPSLDMAARTLGQSQFRTVIRVHLPLIKRGILTGALLVFIESMKELPAALLLRLFNYETLATYVYQFVSDEMLEQGALAALVIVLVGLIPLIILNRSLEQVH